MAKPRIGTMLGIFTTHDNTACNPITVQHHLFPKYTLPTQMVRPPTHDSTTSDPVSISSWGDGGNVLELTVLVVALAAAVALVVVAAEVA